MDRRSYLIDVESPPLNLSDPFLTWSYAEDMIVKKCAVCKKKAKKETARKFIFKRLAFVLTNRSV